MGMVFGGINANDAGVAIVPNGSNSAYVTGYTNSANFPTTPDAFQTVRASPAPQTFVTQVESSTFVGRIVHSTLLSADGSTVPYAIASDNAGGIYVAGSTSSVHLPGGPALTPNPTAGFVSKFSFNLTELFYTKLLGAVVSLPPQVATPTFTVSWAGSDPGSSAVTYDVFMSDDGGPFTPFQTATTATSAPFTGIPGHSYGFFSIATNAAGIAEAMKTAPDVVVTIGATPPEILCTGCYFLADGARATLAFNVSVAGSASTFALNFRNATQAGQFAGAATSQISVNGTSATFSGQGNLNGQSGYTFTVTARDGGGPGSALDTVTIEISGPSGFSYSAAGTIAGGDIVVHQ